VTPSHKERMLRGDPYLASDRQLAAERAQCQQLLERGALPFATGDGTTVMPPVRCDYGYNVKIGARTYVNYGAVLLDPAPITIGDDVQIATNVQLITATHPVDAAERRAGWELAHPVTIADGAWLGAGVIVLPGVTVGEEAVVGAGAVVTKDVAPRTVVAGNPAQVLREL
jgi:maltose O-acetyltransferase